MRERGRRGRENMHVQERKRDRSMYTGKLTDTKTSG